ncbi:MAG: hypothetical protein WC381_10010 [Kiritimatiellia bacterium]
MTYKIDPARGTMLGTPATPAIGFVDHSYTAHYLFWGLLPLSTPDITEIAAQTAGPNCILASISIKEENSFLDGLGALVTYGIYRPRAVEITGKIYNKEGLSYAQ